MNISIDQVEQDVQHVAVSGEVDTYTAPQLREALLPLTAATNQTIIVELADVDYMDSTGLGVFVASLKSCETSGSQLKLRGMTPRVRRIFSITGLATIMDIEDSDERSP